MAAHYPIVFANSEPPVALAVPGRAGVGNSFVSSDNQRLTGFYVPAYIRRYPFALIEGENEFALGIDVAASHLNETHGVPLFTEDGSESDFVRQAVQTLLALRQGIRDTSAMVSEFFNGGLLEPLNEFSFGRHGDVTLTGNFQVVEPDAFAGQPDVLVVRWHRRDWVAQIHYHRQSMRNWADVLVPGPPTPPTLS